MGDVQCELLVGPAAITAQFLLVTIVLLGLFYKRSREVPPRPLLIWGMDVSKQVVSSGMAHILGMLIAMVAQLQATKQVTSECSWYFVTFSVDTTLGVVLVLTMHSACVNIAKRQVQKQVSSCTSEWSSSDDEDMAEDMEQQLTGQRLHAANRLDVHWIYESIADCGSYGNPPSPHKWAVQLAQFSVCVVIARMLCGTVVIVGTGALAPVAAALDRAFRGHPALLLYFVMVACPVCMNTGQAWLQDQFLKWAAWGPSGALSSGATASPRRSDGDWAELGALADGTRARPDDLDERPGPGKLARGGSGPGGDPAARASVAQRQRTPARDATQDWRVRPPHS